MLNHITIHGNLGRDPELKEFQKDGETRKLVNFSVGCSRDFGDETDWFDVTMFGKRADVIDKWFSKGSEIIVWGRMQADTVEKDGNKRKYWKLIADGFDFCRNSSGGAATTPASSGTIPETPTDDDDIPF